MKKIEGRFCGAGIRLTNDKKRREMRLRTIFSVIALLAALLLTACRRCC